MPEPQVPREAVRFPGSYDLQDLPEAALSALAGALGSGLEIEERTNILQHWLVWSQGNSAETRRHWSYLSCSKAICDRDRYVLDLWKSLDRENGANRDLQGQIVSDVAPWDFYQRHFFGWFLSRFNLLGARQVFSDQWVVGNLHGLFVFMALLIVGIALYLGGWQPGIRYSAGALLGMALIVAAGMVYWTRRLSLPLYAFTYSLVPRLGVAVGIGYLFLASAAHLVKAVASSQWPTWRLYTVAVILVLCTFFYVPVHVSRRVYPPPHWRILFRRSRGVVALGIGYAALELLLFAPFFFTSAFLGTEVFRKGPAQLVLCGSIALILGVILQLAWDEKPMTEPL